MFKIELKTVICLKFSSQYLCYCKLWHVMLNFILEVDKKLQHMGFSYFSGYCEPCCFAELS